MSEFDFSEIKAFSQKISQNVARNSQFKSEVGNILASALLRETKTRTPVGNYDGTVFFANKNGNLSVFEGGRKKAGGELRRNWDAKKEIGHDITVFINNPVFYGMFVENGHRTIKGGWVEGRFFMRDSVNYVFKQVEDIVGPIYTKYLESLGF